MADRTHIAALLADSRAAHLRYRENSPRTIPHQQSAGIVDAYQGDRLQALSSLQQAADLRSQAHGLDPDHTDLAWQDEAVTHPHSELTTFYQHELRRLRGDA